LEIRVLATKPYGQKIWWHGWFEDNILVEGKGIANITIIMYPRSKEKPITLKEKDGSPILQHKNCGARIGVGQVTSY
jgi:hypothetical protein